MNISSLYLLLCLAVSCLCVPIENSIEVEVFTNENEILFKYPDAKPLDKIGTKSETRVGIQYQLGQRISGDRLVAAVSDNLSWPVPQDVTLTLRYPNSGMGAIVTYLTIRVTQDTNIGQAYVVSGGIGQRVLHVAVLAGNTRFFSYGAEIYGL